MHAGKAGNGVAPCLYASPLSPFDDCGKQRIFLLTQKQFYEETIFAKTQFPQAGHQ
jgi:hypothetical protein